MRELAERREEIHVAPVDGHDELDRDPLVGVKLRSGLVQRVAHDDPVQDGCGIAKVVGKPEVGLSQIPAQHVDTLELLHAGVDLEIRAAEQLVHYTAALSPFFFPSDHSALSVAHQITRDGHKGSLVGDLPSLGDDFRDGAVRVEHNPCLGAHVQRHHVTVRD